MFCVYRINWLNILSTDPYGDPELGKEISNFVCLTRYTCCAFHNDVKFVSLSFVSYNIRFLLVVIRFSRAKLKISFPGHGSAFLCSVCTVSVGWVFLLQAGMGNRSLARKFWILPRLTRYTCCAFENDFEFVYLSFMSYNIHFLLVVRSSRARLKFPISSDNYVRLFQL
jgi:hypothetical protein